VKARFLAVILVVITCFITAQSCKKPVKVPTSGGGLGGTFTIVVTPEHHGFFVDTCTIYIKYNTLDAPANGIYDDSMVCLMVDTTPVAVFAGLRAGDYYIYAHGYHALYVPPYVKGGVPCTLGTLDTVNVIVPTYSY